MTFGDAVDDRPQEDRAQNGPADRSDAPLQAAAADDRRRNRVELVAQAERLSGRRRSLRRYKGCRQSTRARR